jgi:hypothetical protein
MIGPAGELELGRRIASQVVADDLLVLAQQFPEAEPDLMLERDSSDLQMHGADQFFHELADGWKGI